MSLTINLNKPTLTIDQLETEFDQELSDLKKLYQNEKDPQKAKQILHQADQLYQKYEVTLLEIEKYLDKLIVGVKGSLETKPQI